MRIKITLNFPEAKTEKELREQWIELWEASKNSLVNANVLGHEFLKETPHEKK